MDFRARLAKYSRFYLYGATPALDGAIRMLTSLGKEIVGVIDRDVEKQRDGWMENAVISPDNFYVQRDKTAAVVIVSAYQMEIHHSLVANGVEPSAIFPLLDGLFYPTYGPYFSANEALDRLDSYLPNPMEKAFLTSWRAFKETGDLRHIQPLATEKKQYHKIGWKEAIRPSGLALDIGSFDGASMMELRELAPFDLVIGFEPFAENFRLAKNRLEHHEGSFEIHQIAIGAKHEILRIQDPGKSATASLLTNEVHQGGQAIEVRPLDSFNYRNVSLIKVDIEGYELDFLQGALETLKRERPAVAISAYHKHDHPAEILSFFENHFDEFVIQIGHHPLCVYELEYYIRFE